MKKITKLNNKGFTLIELLAVIVILAVVMGIATTSVLSAMNNSRKSSLQDSALSAADAFRLAYSEYALANTGNLMGLGSNPTKALLNGTAQKLNVSTDVASNLSISATNYDLVNSYVYYDKANSKFTVCLVASSTGSYYVAAAVGKTKAAMGNSPALTNSQMWACSDNTNSWT